MTTDDPRFDLIRRCHDGDATPEDLARLEASLREDAEFRLAYLRYTNLDFALGSLSTSRSVDRAQPARWYAWRPLTAAAAGIVFGMLCTSVVFGYVAQRTAMKKMPLAIYDAGIENAKQLVKDGLPDVTGQWGMDDAQVVPAEHGMNTAQGQHMMRLVPIPRDKEVKNPASRVYQVLDLRSLLPAGIPVDAEVEVAASFCSEKPETDSRYLIRAIALEEAPEQAMQKFWPKVENAGVVSESQRFSTPPGTVGWQRYSLQMRLPPDSKTLVIIFGAMPPSDETLPASNHYLDDVQVSLLTSSENSLP
jgi:hypothetical protein